MKYIYESKPEVIKSPNYILFYRALREDMIATGQTESFLDDPDMAKAEAIAKLEDLGYSKIEILAIENAGKKAIEAEEKYSESLDINKVFADEK